MELTATIRRRVPHLEEAVPFYEGLTDQTARRFAFAGARLAAVGPFLLFETDEEDSVLERVVATLATRDLNGTRDRLEVLGAEVVAPPTATPNGHRLVVRHPDGAVFEYVGP